MADDIRRGAPGSSSTNSRVEESRRLTDADSKVHHRRLRQLRQLDESTKIPFILVELRGISHKNGYIEICGKDEYGVYHKLEEWLCGTMRCTKQDAGDLNDKTPLPFSDQLYKWQGFLVEGSKGTNNMGLATMQLVEFMCNELSWTLGVINGGNVGSAGEIREQQVIFKAPHPMNLEAGHIMIELRSAGYIEICGSDRKAKDTLHNYFLNEFRATAQENHQEFSDRYYTSAHGIFKERGKAGENNLGRLTVKVCDDVVKRLPGWSLVTMNGGNYGEGGDHREQQLVFRFDNHPLGDLPHLMVEFREAGYIEVCGEDYGGMHGKLKEWLAEKWGSREIPPAADPFCDVKFSWKPLDMMVASAECTEFFHSQGWQMQVCSQGTTTIKGDKTTREQQILFRPEASHQGFTEPHMFIELYTGEATGSLYNLKEKDGSHATIVMANQFLRIRTVGECGGAVTKFSEFLTQYLGAQKEPDSTEQWTSFGIDVFLSRGICDNNLGCWTMRICDFMVDRLGWSFVVCNVCNLGPQGQFREQQLVFRWDGERREIPPVKERKRRLDECLFVGLQFPDYWETDEVLRLKQEVGTVVCTRHEIAAMQEIFDHTFRRILTRDRVYEYQLKVTEEMPYRLHIVTMFRSEHAELYRRFMERRKTYNGGTVLKAKTQEVGAQLNRRLGDAEALLAHGTNPSSAMAILKSGFSLSAAGKATGTMFGYGIYLAECVSKSDEYARDDNGGTYPQLMAMLMCRSLVGNPYVVQEAGDYIEQAKQAGCDCVVGDRESKVGTYREFIFFDERQVCPEYAVIYKREYQKDKVPEKMREKAKGSTGRNWQLKLDSGWANCPPDVSHELTRAQNAGEKAYDRMINDVHYTFDLEGLTQTNQQTGTTRQIRPPMRK